MIKEEALKAMIQRREEHIMQLIGERDEARVRLEMVTRALASETERKDEARAAFDDARNRNEVVAEACREARAIADEQAERMKFCSRCKPVPRPWAKDDA